MKFVLILRMKTWGKEQLNAAVPPVEKFNYPETNYHLLYHLPGFIVAETPGLECHQAVRKYIF